MKKSRLFFGFTFIFLILACNSDSNVEINEGLEAENTLIETAVPVVKSVNAKLSPPTPALIPTVGTTPVAAKAPDSDKKVETQSEIPTSSIEIISKVKNMWDQGYSYHSMLTMNLIVSFDDYLQEMPLLMEGDVQNSRNYEGITSFEESDQVKMIQMIVTGKDTFAKYPNTKYWIQFPEDQKPLNPISIVNLLKKNMLEGEFIGVEKSGGTSSQHLAIQLESRIFGEVLPMLENSVGTINLDLWVESDTYRVNRILVDGTALGGPKVKGPNGQDVNIRINIEMSAWDFGKSVAILKPDLPSTPKQLKWDSPPEMKLKEGKDYTAVIKIYGGGEIKIDLLENETPVTVNNFIFLSEEGYYDWVTFHRVIPDFMAQAGDPSGTGRGGPGYRFENEFHPEARHDSFGILSMANSGLMPDGRGTNGSQFFITYRETPFLDGLNLDGTAKDCANSSCHSVFGRVVEGMEVLEDIVPRDPVTATLPGDVIEAIEIIAVPK